MTASETGRVFHRPRAHGPKGAVIDPTENVLSLVEAESRYQNAMRMAESRRQDDLRIADSRRLDDLAALRVVYETKIAEILTVQVKTTSDLISAQLEKTTTNLGVQMNTNFGAQGERIGQLEHFRWEVGGITSHRAEARQSTGLLLTACSAVAAIVSVLVALFVTGHVGHLTALP